MSIKQCDCVNPPSVSIKFGSKNSKEICDIIIPLGVVLPDVEALDTFQQSNPLHKPRSAPVYYPYNDNDRLEQLKFKIHVDYCTIESFELTLLVNGIAIIAPVKQIISGESGASVRSLPCGDYYWEWDGYAKLGAWAREDAAIYKDEYSGEALNTKFLKRHDITLCFKYRWTHGNHDQILKKLVYRADVGDGDWLDTTVMGRIAGNLRLHMRVVCPDKTGTTKYNRDYAYLCQLALKGIEMHWRRNGNDMRLQNAFPYWVPGSVPYLHSVKVRAKAQDWPLTIRADISSQIEKWYNDTDLPIEYDTRARSALWGRNLGYVNHKDHFEYSDIRYMDTAAHEFGHHILRKGYGTDYSWKHKWTSTKMGDDIIKKQEDRNKVLHDMQTKGELKGKKVEFDLMKYWNDKYMIAYLDCTRASNDDVRAALWLSRIRFRLK